MAVFIIAVLILWCKDLGLLNDGPLGRFAKILQNHKFYTINKQALMNACLACLTIDTQASVLVSVSETTELLFIIHPLVWNATEALRSPKHLMHKKTPQALN